MSRLQVRVYRRINQTEQWVMVGATEQPEQVVSWLEEYSYSGLIIHTGFSILPRDILLELLPSASEGVIVCAATQALLPNIFSNKKLEICHGNTGDGYALLSEIDTWFFLLKSNIAKYENRQQLRLIDPNSQAIELNDEHEKLCDIFKETFVDREDLIDVLIKNSIFDLVAFRKKWRNIDAEHLHEIASKIFNHGLEGFQRYLSENASLKTEQVQREGVVKLVSYLPPWAANIPMEPVRTYNALHAENYDSLYDLESEPSMKLLHIPNMGRRSIRLLYEYLINFRVPYPTLGAIEGGVEGEKSDGYKSKASHQKQSHLSNFDFTNAPTIADVIDGLINDELDKVVNERAARAFEMLKRRFAGETLESIAEAQQLTRERIRQITDKALRSLVQACGVAVSGSNINSDLLWVMKDLYSWGDCSHVDFSNFVRVFSGTESFELGVSQRRMLEKLVPEQNVTLVPFKLSSKDVILPLDKNYSEDFQEALESEMLSITESIHGMKLDEAENYAKNHLLGLVDSQFFSSLIAKEIVYYRSSIDEDTKTINNAPNRMTSRQAIAEIVSILRRNGEPMHGIDDIYPEMPAVYKDAVGNRRVISQINEYQEQCPGESADYIFTMGRGRYALWEHFRISDEDGGKCANFIDAYLAENEARQFTDLELFNVLKEKGIVTWQADHVDQHRIVSVILMRYRPENVRYFGRFVWGKGKWTDKVDTSNRFQVNQLIEELIKDKGQPVPKYYIDEHIASTRGRGVTAQYHEKNGLIRLTASGKNSLYWHESLDPVPFNSEQSQILRDEVLNLLTNTFDSGIYMSGLKADIVHNSDIINQFNSAQFLALLLRMPEVRVKKDAFNKIIVSLEKGKVDA